MPCKELAWCREFCGDACKGGTGGLCLLRLMSDLGRTCEAVSQKVVELHGDPSLDDQAHSDVLLHRSDPFVDHGDAIDNGCGYHALCSECSGDCAVEAVQDYFFGLFGQTLEGLTPTVAPAPHAKFALFAQVSLRKNSSLGSGNEECGVGVSCGENENVCHWEEREKGWKVRQGWFIIALHCQVYPLIFVSFTLHLFQHSEVLLDPPPPVDIHDGVCPNHASGC